MLSNGSGKCSRRRRAKAMTGTFRQATFSFLIILLAMAASASRSSAECCDWTEMRPFRVVCTASNPPCSDVKYIFGRCATLLPGECGDNSSQITVPCCNDTYGSWVDNGYQCCITAPAQTLGAGPDEGAMPLYVKDCADKWVLTSVADDLSGGF